MILEPNDVHIWTCSPPGADAQRGIWLRDVLSRYVDAEPGDVVFDHTPHGKPHLRNSPVRFNLSHSGEIVVLAVARQREVGVDVEAIRPRRNLDVLIQDYFSPRERACLANLPDDQRLRVFLAGWTRKEAYLKGIGFGLSVEPALVTVSLPPDEPARLIACAFAPEHVAEWSLTPLAIADDYSATLAVQGVPAHVLMFGPTSQRL